MTALPTTELDHAAIYHADQPVPPGAELAAKLPTMPAVPHWRPDWPEARERLKAWWAGEGTAINISVGGDFNDANAVSTLWPGRGDDPLLLNLPREPRDAKEKWIGLPHRVNSAYFHAARQVPFAETVPLSYTMCIGAGDLAAMVGCGWRFANHTVWFEHCIDDPDNHPPIKLDRDSLAFRKLTEIVVADRLRADGRYYTGVPDLVENIDILAALRDPQTLMFDMIDRPEWVSRCVDEINLAWFEAYDHFYELVKDDEGGSCFAAFSLWAPGKTAKVQCDACSMFGPDMFSEFVVPALTRQCDWLDYSMYHLDGEECWPNLDPLLSIESLDAIEWTPKLGYANEGGGHPKWYDLYRRIKAGGKAVQAITVKPNEIEPLFDAVGPESMSLFVQCKTMQEIEQVQGIAKRYR